ncbi:MAG: hypothetical protein ACR2NN_16590, partial [Bryobacteraceae bacterium]
KRRARMQKRSSFYPLTPNQKGVPAPDRSASYPGSFFDEKMLLNCMGGAGPPAIMKTGPAHAADLLSLPSVA